MASEVRPRAGVRLAPMTTLGVGGPAEWFVEAETVDAVRAALDWAGRQGVPATVLGGGSNVVISDEGVSGLVIRLAPAGRRLTWEGDVLHVEASAGESWDAVVAATVEAGAWGIEGLSGIPGTVGATPIENVGAYGQDVSQVLTSVEVLDRLSGRLETLDAAACGFGYRTSRFRHADRNRYIIASVRLRLTRERLRPLYPEVERQLGPGAASSPAAVRDVVLAIRRSKGMVVDPADPDSRSAGSFFTNPVVSRTLAEACAQAGAGVPPMFDAGSGDVKLPAGWLIEAAGWTRGRALGGAALSRRHALAIVARPGGRAEDVVALAVAVKQAVRDRFGVTLTPEPLFLGFGQDARVRFLEATGH